MQRIATLLRTSLLTAVLVVAAGTVSAANSKTTVQQVTTTVTVSNNVDYVVNSATPFAASGVVNITNTSHAVLILTAVKPSAAISLLADHVKINGQTAVNGTNCQVKIYSQGSIILPYGDDTQPLTVYSGQNYSGDQCSDFGLENTGGFMNTLTDDKLNNRIRSFKLKRGYMVTFSIRPGGYGYSRCFIAANADLEMGTLPDILDQKISSYRIFKWYDTSKKGLADAAKAKDACDALNVTTTYEWWSGKDDALMPDVECVPHHYKESWPTPAMCGQSATSAHMKTNNEPRNPNDEEQCDLNAILNNWERLMATGMRLCSPSSWDGSDYWTGTGFLKDFFDAIDARGWRCDIVDLHGYWLLSNFQTNIPNWYNAVKRPVWVSEWCWGASWNKNGAFASGVTEDQNAKSVESICKYMNGLGYVERYYFWNAEADISKVYLNGSLTKAGEYYAAMNPGLGYTGQYDYVPTTPPQNPPSDLTTVTAAGKTCLRWYESNGELNKRMTVEYSSDGSSWQTVADIEQDDNPKNYTCDASMGAGQYRIHIVDMNNTDQYSETVTVTDVSTYYIYNVGAKQWLCSGNNWGTRASLTSHGGIDVLLTETSNGKYTIDTQLLNGNNHFLSVLDDNVPWMDQVESKSNWEIKEVGQTSDGQTIYLLSSNGGNIAYDGQTTSLVMSSETGVNAQWVLQTLEDRKALLKKASESNPVDASFLIACNDFSIYDLRYNIWQGAPTLGGYFDNTKGNQCAEKFNTDFDVYQTVSGAPAGNYRLQVQGFYRNGGYKDAATKHNSGTESLDAMLYVNEHTVPLKSIFTEAGKLDVGVTTDGINGKFPNTMRDAAQFFLAGLYDDNTIEFSIGEGEELRIGIQKAAVTGNDWTIFDNFRLIYLGNPDATDDLDDLKAAWRAAKANYVKLISVPSDNLTANETFSNVISSQDKLVEAATAEEDILAAIDTASDAAADYIEAATPTEGYEFDLTFLFTNPDVTDFWTGSSGVQPEGWYTENDGDFQVMVNTDMGASGEAFMEYRSEQPATDGYTIYQNVNLPGGRYQVAARVGLQQNVGGTKANVTLSANDADIKAIAASKLTDMQADFELKEQATQQVKMGMKAHEGNCYRWMAMNKLSLKKLPVDPVATAIGGVRVWDDGTPAKSGVCYDLQGRKMVSRKLKSGLYILGGNKMVVR